MMENKMYFGDGEWL